MRVIAAADEAEVVAAFLRAEVDSQRFGPRVIELLDQHGWPRSLLAQPDTSDPAANAARRELLGEHRGFGRDEGMFRGFPEEIRWLRVALTPQEVASVLYIDWDWWLMVSDGSRRPEDTARRMRSGLAPGDPAELEPIAARLRSPDPPPELILLTTPTRERLVVVEGHVRLTAYALYPECLPPELQVYVGESPEAERWGSF